MEERLARQSFLGAHSDQVLAATRVAIIGLGGGGSHVAQQLAHLGVGQFVLLDPDVVEETNLNRLIGATSIDAVLQTPKVDVVARTILRLNSTARIIRLRASWQDHAVLLRECDVIIGCVDKYAEREQVEIAARRYLVPYIDIGMDVHANGAEFYIAGQVILSMPGERCLRCFGFLTDELLAREAENYAAAGSRPQVVWPNGVLASTAVGIFVQLVTPWHKTPLATAYLEYDGNTHFIVVSNRLRYTEGKTCSHFQEINALGDPFWKPKDLMSK